MTLSNLFKAQAIFVWLYAAMFWVAPEFASQGPGWELTPDSISFGQNSSCSIICPWAVFMDGAKLGWRKPKESWDDIWRLYKPCSCGSTNLSHHFWCCKF